MKNSTYTNVANSNNSLAWQSQSGHGEIKETLKLANIQSGTLRQAQGERSGLTVHAAGGIVVDIPDAPAPTPTPDAFASGDAAQLDPNIETASINPALSFNKQDTRHDEHSHTPSTAKTGTAEEQAAQRKTQAPQHLNTHLTTLAQQPGQAWIGQLANDPNVKVQWKQTQTAVQQWDYSHEGLTPEAAGVIALVVAYASAGTAGSAAGSLTGAAGGTTIASAAVTAGLTTLASQATVTLINNKGNVGNTLNDLGRSDNVKALVTAMVTAGALTQLGQSINIGKTNLNGINAQSKFIDQLQKNLINNTASTIVNHAINGGDLQQQLEQSLKTAFIDTGAAQGANLIGDMKVKGDLNAFTHKLAHAIAGCAAGAAKSNDCSSGALGAVVGEMSAELYGDPSIGSGQAKRINTSGPDMAQFKTDTVNFAKLMAGVAVAITGGDANAINLAASTAGNAAENNFLGHYAQAERDKLRAKAASGKELTTEEKTTLAKLEMADQQSDGLLNKYRNNPSTMSKTDNFNLNFYLNDYQQQDGNAAMVNLIKNGPTPTYGFPYAGSSSDQKTYMDNLRAQNGGGLWAFLTTTRDSSVNEEVFNSAMRDSGMRGSVFGGMNMNEDYLPSAMLHDYTTIDALRNSVLATGVYLTGTAMNADPSKVNAATLFASNVSDLAILGGAAKVIGKQPLALTPLTDARVVDTLGSMKQPSGDINTSSRSYNAGNGNSAMPSPGTNTAGNSGAGSGKIFLGEYTFDAMNPGPLPDSVASTFAGGRYNQGVVTSIDEMFFKGGDATNPGGSFFNFSAPNGVAQVRIDNAVRPQWINPVTGVLEAESPINSVIGAQFPIGSTYYYGPVSSQGGVYLGGSNKIQLYVPDARKIGTFTPLGKIE